MKAIEEVQGAVRRNLYKLAAVYVALAMSGAALLVYDRDFTVFDDARGVVEANEPDGSVDDVPAPLVLVEGSSDVAPTGGNAPSIDELDAAELIGSWRWVRWRGYQYVFNRWETAEIARWNGDPNGWAAIAVLAVAPKALAGGYYGLMGTYRWVAGQAQRQGRCLAIWWFSGAAIVPC